MKYTRGRFFHIRQARLKPEKSLKMMTEINYTIRSMTIDDYDKIIELLRNTENVVLGDTDEREPMGRFLDRNPGLSSVAHKGTELAGTILCSHDGRRGYLHHLAVDKRYRRFGIGTELVQRSLSLLSKEGITKCNIFLLEENKAGIAFWKYNGFQLLDHFGWMQKAILELEQNKL
jgi:putative acetyltransferase